MRLLDVLLVLSLVAFIFVSVREFYISVEYKKTVERNKQRELARVVKLQNKIDEFEEFKSRIERFEKCDENCMDCREFNYIKHERCKQAREYFRSRSGAIRNFRITMQDYTIADVLTLYGEDNKVV